MNSIPYKYIILHQQKATPILSPPPHTHTTVWKQSKKKWKIFIMCGLRKTRISIATDKIKKIKYLSKGEGVLGRLQWNLVKLWPFVRKYFFPQILFFTSRGNYNSISRKLFHIFSSFLLFLLIYTSKKIKRLTRIKSLKHI